MNAACPGDRRVPWLPGLADAIPLKYVCSINRATLPDDTPDDLEIRYIDISSVDELGNCAQPQPMEFGNAPSRARRIIRDDDILVATVRTYLRAITHVQHAGTDLICSTGFAVLSAGPRVIPRYLFYWTRSEPFVAAVVSRSVGISYPAINPPELGGLPVAVPPLPNQHAVAVLLDRETAKIDGLIAKKRRLIDLLEEKRTAQISRALAHDLDAGSPAKDSEVNWLGNVPDHWSVAPLYARFEVQLGKMLDARAITGEHLAPYLRNIVSVR